MQYILCNIDDTLSSIFSVSFSNQLTHSMINLRTRVALMNLVLSNKQTTG